MLLEVESKAKIGDLAALRKKIKKIAVYEKTEDKGDDYFTLHKRGYPKKAFRIRYNGKKYVVNFKKHLKKLWSGGVVVKEEYEFEIGDAKNVKTFLSFIKDFGFKEWVKKRKNTESYIYKKDKRITIEINHVKHIGTYLEVEYLARRREVKKAKKKVLETLKELGITKKQIDNIGYTRRLYDKGIRDEKYFITKRFKI